MMSTGLHFLPFALYVEQHLVALPAGLDEGILSSSFPNLLYMENPYSYKKCQ